MNEPNNNGLYLKYWHLVLIIVLQILTAGYVSGRLIEGQDDLTRRVVVIEQTKFVPREEFDSWRREFRDRLDRIEVEIIHRNQLEDKLR